MKKLLTVIMFLALSAPAFAWDIGTYPREDPMRSQVYHYFMDEAMLVQFTAGETDARISFAYDVIFGVANYNSMSVSAATNAGIRAKIIANDPSYVDDLAYVVSTSYEPGPPVNPPLFTILADAKYPVTP